MHAMNFAIEATGERTKKLLAKIKGMQISKNCPEGLF